MADSAERVRVRAFREGDEAAWDAFVRAHPRATFFHQTGWKRVLEATFGYRPHYLLAEREGRVRGVAPLFSCRDIRGRRSLYSLPHTVYGGIVGEERSDEEALLAEARALADREGAKSIELRNRHRGLLDLPVQPGFVTFERELPARAQDVRGLLPKKAREAVNQAVKRHNLEADFESDLDTFYDLLASSYLALGTPVFPRRFFAAMTEEFPEAASILVVRHEGTPVSAVLSMDWRDAILPLYSGEAPGVRNLKANNFKYYRLMQRAVERGVRRFDFGRSRLDNEGTVGFKVNQGFEPEELPYQVAGEAAPPSSPNQGFFARARRIWGRMPRAVADRVGPRIVKYFP